MENCVGPPVDRYKLEHRDAERLHSRHQTYRQFAAFAFRNRISTTKTWKSSFGNAAAGAAARKSLIPLKLNEKSNTPHEVEFRIHQYYVCLYVYANVLSVVYLFMNIWILFSFADTRYDNEKLLKTGQWITRKIYYTKLYYKIGRMNEIVAMRENPNRTFIISLCLWSIWQHVAATQKNP